MPTITPERIEGYAHCRHPRCPGTNQEMVPADRLTASYSFNENGGSIPGEEKSMVSVHFADPEDVACPHCKAPREVTDSPRPQYEALSGFDPNFLVGANPAGTVDFAANDVQDERVAALEAQVAKLTEALGGND